MNILEKISNLFRKKYKTLPEATTRNENPKNKTWLLKNNMNNKETKDYVRKYAFNENTSF